MRSTLTMTAIIRAIASQKSLFTTRVVAGSLLLVPVKSSVADMKEMFSLNETGAFIWECIDECATIETITQKVASQYQIEVQRAEQDLSVFLNKLSDYIKQV
jgi:hypothetical protein